MSSPKMSATKRPAGSDTVPQWGRARTSITSGGTRLPTKLKSTGFFVEDTTYRPKKKRTTVRWQSRAIADEAGNGATDTGSTIHDLVGDNGAPPTFHDIESELNANIEYDPGYTPQERERKVLSLLALIMLIE